MKKATLEQSAKILNLLKGLPRAQVQSIIESRLSPLFFKANLEEIDYEKFESALASSKDASSVTIRIGPINLDIRRLTVDVTWEKIFDTEHLASFYVAGKNISLGFYKDKLYAEKIALDWSFDGWITGDKLLEVILSKREHLQCLPGILQAEALLRQQAKIPTAWQELILMFPGTIYKGLDKMHKARSIGKQICHFYPALVFSSKQEEWVLSLLRFENQHISGHARIMAQM